LSSGRLSCIHSLSITATSDSLSLPPGFNTSIHRDRPRSHTVRLRCFQRLHERHDRVRCFSLHNIHGAHNLRKPNLQTPSNSDDTGVLTSCQPCVATRSRLVSCYVNDCFPTKLGWTAGGDETGAIRTEHHDGEITLECWSINTMGRTRRNTYRGLGRTVAIAGEMDQGRKAECIAGSFRCVSSTVALHAYSHGART
jgi:hypothetical protein